MKKTDDLTVGIMPFTLKIRIVIQSIFGDFESHRLVQDCYCFGLSIFLFLFNLYLLDFGLTERSLGLIGSFMAAGGIVALFQWECLPRVSAYAGLWLEVCC